MKNIILFVNTVPNKAVEQIRKFEKKTKTKYRIVVIENLKKAKKEEYKDNKDIDFVLSCDTKKPTSITKILKPYEGELLAITCRGEKNITMFRSIIPHVPYLKIPTETSLLWSTDKILMRQQFSAYDKSISPKFTIAKDTSKVTLKKIKEKVGFPLVIKPAGLASSLLVSICFHKEELEQTLSTTLRKIKNIYKENGREEEPKLLVEQFMEGEMYSIDAYVNGRGKIYWCPFVHIKTGRTIGFDDFFNYQRIAPTTLKSSTQEKAKEVAQKGIHALGLRNTTVHIELMRTDNGWKIIEIGSRTGGFRDELYELSHNIQHALNDVLIHIPQQPIIPKKLKKHVVVIKFFAKKEGKILKLQGIKKIQSLKSFQKITMLQKVGGYAKFSKHGGKGVCDLILANKDRSELLADIRRTEKTFEIKIKPSHGN